MLSKAVTRVPGDKYDFLLPLAVWLAGTERRLGGKFAELDVFELDFHHITGMQLQRDDAVARRIDVSSSSQDAVVTPLICCSM